MKTFTLTDQEVSAVLFVMGGRHRLQLEPHHVQALDDAEAKLRAAPEPPAADEVAVEAEEPKTKRGRK